MAKSHLTVPSVPVNYPIYLDDPSTANLVLRRDTGILLRAVGIDRDLEWVGFIADRDCWPEEFEAECEVLLGWWRDQEGYADACLRTAEAADRERFSPEGW